MSPPRSYFGPTAPYLLDLLFGLAQLVDYVDAIGTLTPEEWGAFEALAGIDVDQLRLAVDQELADHGFLEQ